MNYLFVKNNIDAPVSYIIHPTEIPKIKFNIEEYELNNQKKKIIQIGAWLRNPYAIYSLKIYKNT